MSIWQGAHDRMVPCEGQQADRARMGQDAGNAPMRHELAHMGHDPAAIGSAAAWCSGGPAGAALSWCLPLRCRPLSPVRRTAACPWGDAGLGLEGAHKGSGNARARGLLEPAGVDVEGTRQLVPRLLPHLPPAGAFSREAAMGTLAFIRHAQGRSMQGHGPKSVDTYQHYCHAEGHFGGPGHSPRSSHT